MLHHITDLGQGRSWAGDGADDDLQHGTVSPGARQHDGALRQDRLREPGQQGVWPGPAELQSDQSKDQRLVSVVVMLSSSQIVFLNSQTDLGKLVGEIISKTTGLSYWDNPFQVTL